MRLPESLVPGGEERAVRLLAAYYAPLSGRNSGYTGGCWDTFDPSRTRHASSNVFTADDLIACSLLSVEVGGRAAFEILETRRAVLSELLSGVGEDQDLADVDDFDYTFKPVRALYGELTSLPGVGETRATKLIARKRPRLVPIIDGVVRNSVFEGRSHQWAPLHERLQADGKALHHHLLGLRSVAGLPEEVTALRIFDVLAWIEGSGNADRILGGGDLEPPVEASADA